MTELKEYVKKENIKKFFFEQLQQSKLTDKIIIEMLEELINLYKN